MTNGIPAGLEAHAPSKKNKRFSFLGISASLFKAAIADNVSSVSEVYGAIAEQIWAKWQRHETRYALLGEVD